MNELKDKINLIIEMSCKKPTCGTCEYYYEGACLFRNVNERNGAGSYKLNNRRATTANYSCDNYNGVYSFNEDTLDVLHDILKDIERVNEAKKNLELLLDERITESDFVDMMR